MTNGERWAQAHPELRKVQGASRHANLAQPTKRKRKVAMFQEDLPHPTRNGDVITITIPLPHRGLNPNGREVWQSKSLLTKAAFSAAAFLVGVVARDAKWTAARLDVERWASQRADDDNLWSSLKPTRDGIAKALGTNDQHFTCGSVVQHTGTKSEGKRQLRITITRF